ncbi:MAG: 50S ribosomal protein L13 [Lentisphaerae bacterium]|nr:50S ribosomal protein L13 [Lentisphaerota bacterium]
MKTSLAKDPGSTRAWRVMDAAGQPLGRLAVKIADALRGKDRPTYTPHVDSGDFVVVVNAAQVVLTGRKEEQKIYARYTGHRGGHKEEKASLVRARHPERLILNAVKGMLPGNNLCRHMLRRLKVYPGPDHPHQAQLAGRETQRG